jgi:hypothetical protein
MAGLNGPQRLQLTRTPPGFALEEIRVNGIDVMTSRSRSGHALNRWRMSKSCSPIA